MKISRRSLLRTLTGAAAAAVGTTALGRSPMRKRPVAPTSPQMPAISQTSTSRAVAGNPLRIPPTFQGDELVASIHTQEIFPGVETTVWTLGGQTPGPTIRVRRGDPFAVRLRNELAEETIVHWHGQLVPPEMDGHPMEAIAPGASFDYAYDVVNRAGTYFYHPHPHERTGPQAYRGMGGFYLVSDEEEEALDLPDGAFDVPLMVQDKIFTSEGELSYDLSATQKLNGLLGDTILVNGTPEAYLAVSADLYRFRVLNACNARIMKIGFADGTPFHLIGTDGGLLDRPYEADALYLAPAERIDILVDFSAMEIGSSLQLMTLGFGGATSFRTHGFAMPLLRFDVTTAATTTRAVPPTLSTITPIDPSTAARTRVWELDTRPVPLHGHHHRINGTTFDMERIDVRVAQGETEIWEIRNMHTMPHPIHAHGVRFQVIERINGEPLAPRDYGWKDTVIVWGEETVRVIVRFDAYEGVFLFHCHNLEHEDEGMMINFEIGEGDSDVRIVEDVGVLDLR